MMKMMLNKEASEVKAVDPCCCVCGHPLKMHLFEKGEQGDGWRCHCIGMDCFQCECHLRKRTKQQDLNYYNLQDRIADFQKIEKEWMNDKML